MLERHQKWRRNLKYLKHFFLLLKYRKLKYPWFQVLNNRIYREIRNLHLCHTLKLEIFKLQCREEHFFIIWKYSPDYEWIGKSESLNVFKNVFCWFFMSSLFKWRHKKSIKYFSFSLRFSLNVSQVSSEVLDKLIMTIYSKTGR